ncbi:MAG: hypothetical protein HYU64_13645 [Armatimonadetes bacterium]|nr:hypothetical protein [Armatimonadota bacterium]
MYDSRTGRVFDGIDEKGVNYNSGAEATISGLLALQEILECPQMVSYLPCRETAARRFRIWPARSDPPHRGNIQPAVEYRVFEKSGRRLALVKNFGESKARVIFPEGKWQRTRVDIFDDLGNALLHKTCTPTPLDRLELPPFGYCLLEEIS